MEAGQQRIAAQCRQVATKALDRINDRLDQPKAMSTRELIPIAGVAIDKIVMLYRGAKLPDLHQHLHQHLYIDPDKLTEAAKKLIAQAELVAPKSVTDT